MDEKQLEELSSSSGIPLELLSRSIQARAESSGVSPADILNSWSGGESIDPLPVSKEEVKVIEETVDEVEDSTNNVNDSVEEQVLEPVSEENVNKEYLSSVAVKEEDIPPPVTISQKIIKALKSSMAAKKNTAEGATGQGGIFLRAPDVFQLRYLHRGKDHPFLNSFKHCALTGMQLSLIHI